MTATSFVVVPRNLE